MMLLVRASTANRNGTSTLSPAFGPPTGPPRLPILPNPAAPKAPPPNAPPVPCPIVTCWPNKPCSIRASEVASPLETVNTLICDSAAGRLSSSLIMAASSSMLFAGARTSSELPLTSAVMKTSEEIPDATTFFCNASTATNCRLVGRAVPAAAPAAAAPPP